MWRWWFWFLCGLWLIACYFLMFLGFLMCDVRHGVLACVCGVYVFGWYQFIFCDFFHCFLCSLIWWSSLGGKIRFAPGVERD